MTPGYRASWAHARAELTHSPGAGWEAKGRSKGMPGYLVAGNGLSFISEGCRQFTQGCGSVAGVRQPP